MTPAPTILLTPPCPLPTAATVRELLDGLVEPAVTVDAAPVRARSTEWQGVCAPLVRDNGILAAALVGDAAFAARASAAMLLEPAESVADPRLDDEVAETAKEVLNVLSGAMNSRATPHVKLDGCHQLPGDLPASVDALLSYPHRQRELVVGFEGYGKGRLTAVVW